MQFSDEEEEEEDNSMDTMTKLGDEECVGVEDRGELCRSCHLL